ncbi:MULTISPECIES: hypothetical protein [Haloferax]|uniref:Uncharacterized protein n=1 Tax=Haloferax marinum TaxID=2666143 RepID=A0A6A8G2J4_9EURY|nr:MULTISPECIES: hypothetical protein [Haloferax]KAB1196367.1 hypothetical protein Hfx1150_02075 [Haloferax sp. CBA1150]MRW95360.1 hypothetical protein [Haloferax marinum]
MSDVSLSSVLSFLDADEVATVLRQVHAKNGERTKRSERDGRTFLFVAERGETQPSEVVWVDVDATFDERTVEVFAERCESQGVAGTLQTTGDEDQARETLAFAFATEDQLEEPEDEDEEPRLLVDPKDVDVPITLTTLDDLVEATESAELASDVVDEYHEPHQPEFEEVLDEIDAEEAAAEANEAASQESGSVGLLALLLVLAVLAVVVFLFGPF